MNTNIDTEASLCLELEVYCKVNGIPFMSADELCCELSEIGGDCNKAHIEYLSRFIERWKVMADRDWR